MSPRLVQVSLPLTDDEKPIRLALWRATDRSYKQASEALTRVRTNVAAKVQDENPAPDFSREEKQEHSGGAASYSLDTPAWEARLRRVSAVFSEDPLVLRSQVSLTVEADNRYYINSEGSQIVTGDVGVPHLHSGRDEGGRRHGASALHELLRDVARRTARRASAHRRGARDGRSARATSHGARSSSRSPARRFCPAAPPACSSTRFSAIASKATASATPMMGRRSRAGSGSRCCPRF